jgi:hypothetical protein
MNWLSKLNQSPGSIPYPLRLLICFVIGWGFAIIFFPYVETHPGVHALFTLLVLIMLPFAIRDRRKRRRAMMKVQPTQGMSPEMAAPITEQRRSWTQKESDHGN